MKIKDIVLKKDKDLEIMLIDLEKDLTNLKFKIATKESDKFMDISKTKKQIAQIKTILREREISRKEEKDEKNV